MCLKIFRVQICTQNVQYFIFCLHVEVQKRKRSRVSPHQQKKVHFCTFFSQCIERVEQEMGKDHDLGLGTRVALCASGFNEFFQRINVVFGKVLKVRKCDKMHL